MSEHNLGLGSVYTRLRRRRPVRLVWAAEFSRVEDASVYEKQIQGWSRAKRVALIEGRFDALPDLASARRAPDSPSGG